MRVSRAFRKVASKVADSMKKQPDYKGASGEPMQRSGNKFVKALGSKISDIKSASPTKGIASTAINSPPSSGGGGGIMGRFKKALKGRRIGPFKFKEGGSVRKRAAGSPPKGETRYEVLGRSVTKEQYDAASKEMDRPKSKVEEDMDDFAKKAKERLMKPKKMMSGGMADKAGRAMKKTAADAKGRAMTKAPKKMMGGGMAKYAKGGSVACGPATRGYGAARKSK
jgi:hypothetical protein